MSNYTPTPEKLQQLYANMAAKYGYTALAAGQAASWLAQQPLALLLVGDNPTRFPEVWDVAVLLPDVVALLAPEVRDTVAVGLSHPEDAASLISAHGLMRVPALAAFKNGVVQSKITGVKDWAVYQSLMPLLFHPAPASPTAPLESIR